ncbi:kinase-like domain-containing protein [Mycena galopus ATCC 62051]|nr:kinase-like domain-containing protein [Mycena galopus ATCC 62051]
MRTDEERIATFLVSILSSQSYEETVLRLEGDSAQHFLDVVQETLDRGFLTTQEHNRMALRIIRKLSESCDMLPTSLFIVGVHDRDEHPSFGGGFADVYRASYGNQRVALKRMRHFLRGSNLRRIHLKFCREALLWKDLHHPNILPFLGIDRDSFPSFLCMVSHWMDHGTVMNYLKTYGHANVDKLLYEIAQGLEYLHSHNIVHGDLRGANILIKQDWSACLTDFGLSTFSDATATMSTTRAGSFYWMAPELLLPERFGLKFARTPATDVYAFGCVCFELYTERPPFSAWPEPAVLMKVLEGERPERPTGPPMMTDTLWQHITDFLVESPPKRPSTPVLVQNMTWPRLVPHPSTPSAPLTAGNLPGPTPPATNESLLSSAVVSTAEETAILAHESSIPSLADADSPFLDPADLGIGTEMPNTLSEEEVTNATASELANPTAIVGDTYDAGNPYPPPMSTEKVLDTGAEQRGYASVPMNWPLVNAGDRGFAAFPWNPW